MDDARAPARAKASPWPFVAMGAMACLLFLYGASALFLPWWGVALLYVVWLALFPAAVRRFGSRPVGSLLPPVLGFAAWLVAWLLVLLR